MKANIEMASAIIGLESETHDIAYEINENTATLSLRGDPLAQQSREFILIIGQQYPHKTFAVVEEHHSKLKNTTDNVTSTSIMLSFYPTYVTFLCLEYFICLTA